MTKWWCYSSFLWKEAFSSTCCITLFLRKWYILFVCDHFPVLLNLTFLFPAESTMTFTYFPVSCTTAVNKDVNKRNNIWGKRKVILYQNTHRKFWWVLVEECWIFFQRQIWQENRNVHTPGPTRLHRTYAQTRFGVAEILLSYSSYYLIKFLSISKFPTKQIETYIDFVYQNILRIWVMLFWYQNFNWIDTNWKPLNTFDN